MDRATDTTYLIPVPVKESRCHGMPAAGALMLAVGLLIAGLLAVTLLAVNSDPELNDENSVRLRRKWVKNSTRLQMVEDTISALERALDHLMNIGQGINLDAVFTVRLMEAQLMAFNRHVVLQDGFWIKRTRYRNILQRLDKLQEKARKFQEDFTAAVRINQPEYYKHMNFELSAGSWDMWHPVRDIDPNDVPTYGFNVTGEERLNEDQIDLCLKEPYANQCQFGDECWKLMTSSLYNGYSLTHEILYILNSFALGCDNEVELSTQKWLNMNADALLAKECAAVLHEAELIASRKFPTYHRDLFMEQVTFCGILGYQDFFQDEWLEEILSWQSEKGCYVTNQTAMLEDYQRDFPTSVLIHRRKKRNDLQLEDGCSAHMTGVALTALGQHVRFLLEPLF